jgi:hypothetical protein
MEKRPYFSGIKGICLHTKTLFLNHLELLTEIHSFTVLIFFSL